MDLELRKAERALAKGDRDEARVYAWNALGTIEPDDVIPLLRVAEELDDKLLIQEIERRGIPSEPRPQPAKSSVAGRIGQLLFPLIIVTVLVLTAVDHGLGEAGPIEPGAKDTTSVRREGLPVLRENSGIWLVRIGPSERVPLRKLADDLTFRYHLPIGVLPEIGEIPRSALDDREHQLTGEELIRLLGQWYEARGDATIIGVTDYDMRSRALDLSYTFALRGTDHYGVVSTSRLGAGVFDRMRGNTRYKRTRKVVARNIGFLFLRRPQVADPHSLFRTQMSGTDDIDALVEQF
jgi:hypothetical protein